MENPIFLAIGTIMVALLVAAWLFPDQRWLDPFRSRQLSRPRQTKRPESPASSFQRFNRIHAGVSIMLAGVAILFGHYVMSAMTATDPEAEGRLIFPMVFAAIFFVAGAVVLFARSRV